MWLAAGAGCFVYGEGTLVSIVQEIVVAPNLLYLQWQMVGRGQLSSPCESQSNSPVICEIGTKFLYPYYMNKCPASKGLTSYFVLKCCGEILLFNLLKLGGYFTYHQV